MRLSTPTKSQQLRDAAIKAFMQQSRPDMPQATQLQTPHSRDASNAPTQQSWVASDALFDESRHEYTGQVPKMAGLARWAEEAEGITFDDKQSDMQKQHRAAGSQHERATVQRGQHRAQHGDANEQQLAALMAADLPEGSCAAHQEMQHQDVVTAFASASVQQVAVTRQVPAALDSSPDLLADRSSDAALQPVQPLLPSLTSLDRHAGLLHKPIVPSVHHSMQDSERPNSMQGPGEQVLEEHVDPEVAQLATDFSNSQLAEFVQSAAPERLVAIHVRSEKSLNYL